MEEEYEACQVGEGVRGEKLMMKEGGGGGGQAGQ